MFTKNLTSIRIMASLVLVVSAAQPAWSVDLNGTWTGTLDQVPAGPQGSAYTVVLSVPALDKSSVDYPTLKCGGNLSLVSSDDSGATFREKITRGCETCEDGGIILIKKINATTATYEWKDPNPSRGITCRGQIFKK